MVRKLFTQAGMPEDGDFSWTSFLMFFEDIELPAEATSKDFEEASVRINKQAQMYLELWKLQDTTVSAASQPASADREANNKQHK